MRKTRHDFDSLSSTAAAALFFLFSRGWIAGLILPVGAQAVPESDAAPPGRELFSLQRTGGPLPLSLRLEVEAAAQRSAHWLRRRIADDFRPDDREFLAATRAWAAMTRKDSGTPSPMPTPSGSAQFLERLAGKEEAQTPESRLWLKIFRNPGAPDPSEREIAEFAADLDKTAREFLQHDDGTLAFTTVKRLLELYDTAAMARLEPRNLIADRAMRGKIAAKLEEMIRERPPKRPERRAAFYAGIAAATLLLSDYLPVHGIRRTRKQTLSPILVQGWEFLSERSMALVPEESWLLIRALNRTAPNLLIDKNASPERTLDWRSDCARQLLQLQNITPADGSGYWSRPDGSSERTARQVPDFIATAYAYLILLQL